MSAFVTIIGSSTYRLSGFTQAHDSNTFEGRLANELSVETKAKATDSGNPIRSLSLVVNNTDNLIDLTSQNLWGCAVTVEVDGITDDFTGVIRSYNQDGNGNLSITVTEETLSWFKKELPDEIVRVSSYANASRDSVGTPIPTPFGGTSGDPLKVKGILVDRVNFRFILCAGEIRSVVAVYKNREVITAGSPAAFTTYLGTSGQTNFPGFAYIEFAADPRDENGAWPEILVDIVGLKLGASSEAECRNPARVLYYLLTTASTGACGWGLGIDTAKLGTTFTQAIADCASNSFYLDGCFFSSKTASYWINQICLVCRGRLLFINGKIEFYIDKNTSSASTYTVDNTILLNYGKWESNTRKNRHVLDYRYDIADGVLLSTAFRDDATSQALIQINEDRQEAMLLRDAVTANKIVDYLSRVETYGEDRIRFQTTDFTGVTDNSVITITRADLGLSGALFRVISLEVNGFTAIVEARSYSTDVFGNDASSSTTDPPLDPRTASTVAPPVATSGISLAAAVRVQADGTLLAYIDGTFTMGDRTLYTMIEVGEGATPATWINIGNFNDGSFHFEPCKLGTLYTFRFTAKNVTGGATPVTGSITSGADATAPGTPVAPVCSVLHKSIRVKCGQNATKAPDLAGFKIFRHTSNDSAASSEIGFQPCTGNEDNVVFLDEGTAYEITYYYWTKAVDKSGNVSGFSAVGGPVTTATIVGDDIASSAVSALKIAVGAVDASKLAVAAISSSTGNLNTGVVSALNIAAGAVDATKTSIAAINATTGNLNANTVTAANIVAGTITATEIAAATITAAKIVSGTITTTQIAANTIVAGNIAAGTITATQIAAGTITATQIAAATITAANIVSGTITALQIAANTITASQIAAGTITATQIAAGTITGDRIQAGTINADRICGGTLVSAVTLCAQCGTIGGWILAANVLYSCNVRMYSGIDSHIEYYICTAGLDFLTMGRCLWSGSTYGWECHTGISYADSYGALAFQLSSGRKVIGGWNFHSSALFSFPVDGNHGLNLESGIPSIYSTSIASGVTTYAFLGKAYFCMPGYAEDWRPVSGFHLAHCNSLTFGAGRTNCDGAIYLPNSEYVGTSTNYFWVGDSTNYMRWRPGSLKIVGSRADTASFIDLSNLCSTYSSIPVINVYSCASDGIKAVAWGDALRGESLDWGTGVTGIGNAFAIGVFGRGSNGVQGLGAYCYGSGVWGRSCVSGGIGVKGSAEAGAYGGYFESTGYPALGVTNGAWIWNGAWIGVGLTVSGPVWASSFVCTSSRHLKYDNTDVLDIMTGIRSLSVQAYKRYSDDSGKWHFGTYAEDFQSAFPWIADGKNLSVDVLLGITLKGLQETDSYVQRLETRIAALEDKLAA